MARFARRVDNQLRRGKGAWNGLPRLLNVDTGVYSLGYTEANTEATTAFSRVKTSKALFSGNTDITAGSLIQDRYDMQYYLVMGAKGTLNHNETSYVHATLLWAHATCTIQRFTDGARNAFGRVIDPAPTDIASNVRVTTSAVTIDMTEQEDRSIPKDKTKVWLQSSYDVQENDRLVVTDEDGTVENYRVVRLSPSELRGLTLLYVETDQR